MKIYEVSERPAKLVQQLIQVWEKSVRATHLFLSDEEVKAIKKYVPQATREYIDDKVSRDAAGKDRPRRPVRPAARRSEEESSEKTLAGGNAEQLPPV